MCLCVGVCDGRGEARSLSLGSRSSVCLGGSLTVGRLSSSVKSRARKKSGFFFLCEERSSQLATTETDRPTSNGEGQRKKSRLFGCRPVTLRAGCHAPRDFFRGIFWYFWPGPGGWEERTTEERERKQNLPGSPGENRALMRTTASLGAERRRREAMGPSVSLKAVREDRPAKGRSRAGVPKVPKQPRWL